MALLELKDRMTDCRAKAAGKNHFGLGYACSKKTTSEPDLAGKYDASSKRVASPQQPMMNPMTQYIIDRPTEPVLLRILAAVESQLRSSLDQHKLTR